jgi:hypothetical protein
MTASGAPTPTASPADHLTRRDFFHDVAESLRQLLPEQLRGFHANTTHNLLKVSYSSPRIHYEVWANARDRHIEVGLHFEDGPESTERLLSFLNEHIVEIKHELGAGVELERWTNSWGHLFQLIPYQPLTDDLTREISLIVARMITLLQPMLTEAGEVPLRR